MSWNYRIIRHAEGHLALHEVYYDEDGKPNSYTEDAISFVVDAEEGVESIISSLEMALNDAKNRAVLASSDFAHES